jgi:FKBP-type peptidyl-prolyl cis-trans isomerase
MCHITMQPKGSSFEGNEKAFLRLTLGQSRIIPGLEEALRGMQMGGVRRVIIPENLGYPDADYKNWEPAPKTFSVRPHGLPWLTF